MTPADLVFKNFETFIRVPEEPDEILLVISDSLDSAYRTLSDDFKQRIINFINKSSSWYPISREKINQEFSRNIDSVLATIFILSEMSDDILIFGLEYNIDEDEHGRGLKINENMQILEYGDADIAFY